MEGDGESPLESRAEVCTCLPHSLERGSLRAELLANERVAVYSAKKNKRTRTKKQALRFKQETREEMLYKRKIHLLEAETGVWTRELMPHLVRLIKSLYFC